MSSKKNKKRKLDRLFLRTESKEGEDLETQSATDEKSPSQPAWQKFFFALIAVLIPLTLWSYWPTFVWMEDQWRNEPDYSHGYLVLPLALGLLYSRRDIFPGLSRKVSWIGFLLLMAAIAIRVAGRMAYMDFLDGWTLVLWVGGIVWIFGGWPLLRWSLPSVVFLLLLVPLPYQAESLLSWRLQGFATDLSVGVLQIMNFPAISEGHTIWLDDHQMMVEEACSGLRIFVGMGAMGYMFAMLSRRAWVDKFVILAAALPIAIAVNVFRVTGTVLAFHWMTANQAKIAHDMFGVAMIILGALLLAGVKLYWENLYRPLEITTLDIRGLAAKG